LSKYVDIALPTLLWDEAGPEYGIVLPIFISASDTPGPYFFWPAAGAVAAIIAAQNAANAKSFVIVSPPYRASRQATESTPRLFGGALLLFDRFFAETVGHGALDSMAARCGE